jgi:hypothetical protein
VRLPTSNDTRLLVAGVAAFLALAAYLGVALANTRATVDVAKEVAPWTPHASTLQPIPRRKGRGFDVRVTPTGQGSFGALVSTLVSAPPSGSRFVVGLWLKGSRPGRIGVEVDEFAPKTTSVYVVEKTVPATRKWHHYTFGARVKGSWLGLGMYVYRLAAGHRRPWFALRGLTAADLQS